jgi:hypothetical protein
MKDKKAKISIHCWYRRSTKEWVAEITLQYLDTAGSYRYTGKTNKEARNAAFAAIGGILMDIAIDADENSKPLPASVRNSPAVKAMLRDGLAFCESCYWKTEGSCGGTQAELDACIKKCQASKKAKGG